MGNTSIAHCNAQCKTPCKTQVLWVDGAPHFQPGEPGCGISGGEPPNSKGMINHHLLCSARDGDLQKCREALAKGAYLETRRPFVCHTSNVQSQSVLEDLKKRSPRGTGLTPLMCAAQGGHHAVILELLGAKADVNSMEEDGMRPLHFAAQNGDLRLCQLLMEAGAKRHATDDEGRTPFHYVPASCIYSKADKAAWEALQ